MKNIGMIGWYFWIGGVVLIIVLLLTMTGCSRKTYESVIRDTVTVDRTDSVIINMREVELEVPVPQITLEQWVPIDTLSILDNGLYISVVEVVDGQIHHTLKPVEGATVPATVIVSDTTHISTTVTNTSHVEKEKQFVKEQEPWWQRIRNGVGTVSAMVLVIAAVMFIIRRRE